MTTEGQGRDVVRDILNRGYYVYEWPSDEARAYRENGGFTAGREAVERIRIDKIVAAVRAEVEAERDALQATLDAVRAMCQDRATGGSPLLSGREILAVLDGIEGAESDE